MSKKTALIFFAAAMFLTVPASAQSIVGVWKVTDEATAGPQAKTKKVTQPRMYFFTKKHYSIIAVTSDTERAAIDSDTASAEDLRNVFVDSFVANAGTYDYGSGKLSIWPTVAKNPTYMHGGTTATFLVKFKGKTMTITSETANNYPVKTPTTLTFTRVE